MHDVDTGQAMVISKKFDIFADTTSTTAHPGGCVCIQIYVDKFTMETGYPRVTSNRM